MSVLAYARVSTDDQTTQSQRHAIDERYRVSEWFTDDAVSGVIKAKDRPGLGALLGYVRNGDTVVVSAIDRLGRNTIDVLETVEHLRTKGASVVSLREGFDLSTPHGKLMLTMLAAMAELERENIKARQMAGIEKAKAQGKALGREKVINDAEVAQWRKENNTSIKATADHFGVSTASVKRACRVSKMAATETA